MYILYVFIGSVKDHRSSQKDHRYKTVFFIFPSHDPWGGDF